MYEEHKTIKQIFDELTNGGKHIPWKTLSIKALDRSHEWGEYHQESVRFLFHCKDFSQVNLCFYDDNFWVMYYSVDSVGDIQFCLKAREGKVA